MRPSRSDSAYRRRRRDSCPRLSRCEAALPSPTASAQIKGLETDLEWAASSDLLLSGGATYLHAVTTANYCGPSATIPGTVNLSTNCPNQVNTYNDKASLVARYSFPVGAWQAFVQGSGMYQTSTEPLLRLIDQIAIGPLPAYALFDLSTGAERNGLYFKLALTNVTDKRAQLTRFVECTTTTCGPQPYVIPTQPRTIALSFGQRF